MNVVEELRLPGLEEGLARVEAALTEATAAEDPFLSEVAAPLASAGGKRLRPALLIVSSQACAGGQDTAGAGAADHETVSREAVMGGVAVELVHLGSLYHDDVMDEA